MKVFVICCNDFPHEVAEPGTSVEQAEQRCLDLRAEYMKQYPDTLKATVHFHYKEVPVWEAGK